MSGVHLQQNHLSIFALGKKMKFLFLQKHFIISLIDDFQWICETILPSTNCSQVNLGKAPCNHNNYSSLVLSFTTSPTRILAPGELKSAEWTTFMMRNR